MFFLSMKRDDGRGSLIFFNRMRNEQYNNSSWTFCEWSSFSRTKFYVAAKPLMGLSGVPSTNSTQYTDKLGLPILQIWSARKSSRFYRSKNSSEVAGSQRRPESRSLSSFNPKLGPLRRPRQKLRQPRMGLDGKGWLCCLTASLWPPAFIGLQC